MGIATRNALWAILAASTAVAALAALLWLDSLAFDWAGYSTGSWNKLAITGLAAASAYFARRMLVDANELMWGLLVVAAAATFVVGTEANLSYRSPGCPDFDRTIILGSFPLLPCYERTDVGVAAVWAITVSSLVTAVLALCLPIIELWDRTRVEQKN